MRQPSPQAGGPRPKPPRDGSAPPRYRRIALGTGLALAAGLALPLLGLFGYAPGARDAQARNALLVAYCVLPCVLKLAAAACLYFLVIKRPEGVTR